MVAEITAEIMEEETNRLIRLVYQQTQLMVVVLMEEAHTMMVNLAHYEPLLIAGILLNHGRKMATWCLQMRIIHLGCFKIELL